MHTMIDSRKKPKEGATPPPAASPRAATESVGDSETAQAGSSWPMLTSTKRIIASGRLRAPPTTNSLASAVDQPEMTVTPATA